MNKTKLYLVTVLAFLSIISFVSCDKDDPIVTTELGYQETNLPTNISELYQSRGDESSDTVWVYLQGGPVTELEGFDLEEDAYTFFEDDLRVYPSQTQIINTTITAADDFTFENAKMENEITAELVNQVVTHFKDQGKIVYIIGHSYGAFVAQEVLRLYGPIASHTMILNGRIDMDREVWTGFSKGEVWTFDDMGLNPSFVDDNAGNTKDQNLNKMAAGAGHRRYTQDLANVDLSTVTFVSGELDDAVGRFSAEELAFAEQNAGLGVVFEGFGHGDVFEPTVMKSLHDRMINLGETQEGFHPNGIKILEDKTPIDILTSNYSIDGGTIIHFWYWEFFV